MATKGEESCSGGAAVFDNAANPLRYCGGKAGAERQGAEMINLPWWLRVADFTENPQLSVAPM